MYVLLLLLISILFYIIYNLYNKIIIYEKIIYKYDETVNIEIVSKLNDIIQKINNVDTKGAFKSDDEVGFIWTEINKIINNISNDIFKDIEKITEKSIKVETY